MQKGSLVQLKESKRFTMNQIYKAYELGILLPIHGQILTLAEDPITRDCVCGNPNCENTTCLKFEEIRGEYSSGLFEELQAPGTVKISKLLDSSQSH